MITSNEGLLLTLTGGAGAGKTTLAAALAAHRDRVTILHLDDYYHAAPGAGSWMPDHTGTLRLDVGDPRSVDFARLDADAALALTDGAVVIAEGLFAVRVNPPSRHTRFDIFVDLAADLRLVRKIERKCVRDGFPVTILLSNYVNHRRDAHERHTEPARRGADLVVDAEQPADLLAARIWQALGRPGQKVAGEL